MNEADYIYDSRDEQFKEPFGALEAGRPARFRVLARRAAGIAAARMAVKYDRHPEPARYDMKAEETPEETDDYICYSVTVPFYDRGLYWYSFEFETRSGLVRVGRGDFGRARPYREGENLAAWQLTVYKRDYQVPEWLEGGVIYHIFVDRFCKSGDRVELPGKINREDWGGTPEWKPVNGEILNNDFFGGNLDGIREKLPYLEGLGVTCLYLSPIFEAYSNHKYDTADYSKIDPMFGDEEKFKLLCEEAKKRGIRIILDGVFSHTGADSVYFDKFGHYGGHGAYSDPDSKYRKWYYFRDDGTYESWWGINTLPRINKKEPSYVDFICGEDGIARKWLRAGASGWRLDVADELPNSFLEKFAEAVKTEKPDCYLVGEVWEDASNKISYSERKNYFEGNKLDAVMNYPLRQGLISFIRNGDAGRLTDAVDTLLENYPPEVMNCMMNNIGTHDSVRILTALGGRDLGPDPSREEEAAERMSPEERERAVRMLMIASAIQMTLPGVPCIYYGDEAGMEGYSDPFNRGCFPWGHENRELQSWYRRLIAFRRRNPVYRKGLYRQVASFGGLFAFERFDRDEAGRPVGSVITAANCGGVEEVLVVGENRRDVLTGREFRENITIFPGEVLILETME